MTAEDNQTVTMGQELAALEPIFHRPELGTSRSDFEGMMDVDFWEVGASGNTYSRAVVLDVLEQRHQAPVTERLVVTDFAWRRISDDTYLVTYQLAQDGGRLSRRSTLWRRSTGGWQALYHQGTLISNK